MNAWINISAFDIESRGRNFKTLKETIVRVLEFLSQETSLRSSRLKQKSPFNLKKT